MKVTNAKQLSSYLKDVRQSERLSQEKVASKVGIRQDTVSNFELQPGTTKLETLFRILAALNLELEVKPRGHQQETDGWKEEW
ncbi:transcriptional regulator [Pantoea rodasii]|uniref:Transcriptional regulator n=1 Tax=Pantoea rodasii TaxID=1076549 RepID=A0A2M9WDY8_9GAMM|nr:helix-turn-helix domain-containing protein [Pantoea rodasii]ORM63416.1 transcriptional regulator [Pantoea rodasii]PJZ05770.1 transcriptional regulator [Pantoea rodasii]